MPHMTARQAAVQALLKVDGEGGYSNLVLNEQLKKAQLSPEDTAFASRLFYGTLERKLTLDHIIGAYSKKPVHKLTPAVGNSADEFISAGLFGQRARFGRGQ